MPFNSPINPHAKSANTTVRINGIFIGLAALNALPKSPAPTTPANAMLDPADRSVPPVKITIVIPNAAIPYIEKVRMILSKLLAFINSGFTTLNPITKKISNISTNFC